MTKAKVISEKKQAYEYSFYKHINTIVTNVLKKPHSIPGLATAS